MPTMREKLEAFFVETCLVWPDEFAEVFNAQLADSTIGPDLQQIKWDYPAEDYPAGLLTTVSHGLVQPLLEHIRARRPKAVSVALLQASFKDESNG